ncbi:MAG: DUF952 domain-containing protein [Bdellovibrionota bacterium]
MIFHITSRTEWKNAEKLGSYRTESLEKEGFIHFSLPHQICEVADRRFRGVKDLVLLEVNPEELGSEIRFEDLYDEGEEFPHVYGEVPVSAVVAVHEFAPGADGSFQLPPSVESA